MGAYESRVAGLEYRGEIAARVLDVAGPFAELGLQPEPENLHDPNAIRLFLGGTWIGYLPARHAEWVIERLEDGRFVAVYVAEVERERRFMRSAVIGARLIIATSIYDAPDGTAAAREAEAEFARYESEREAHLLRLGEDSQIQPAVTEIVALLRWIGVSGRTDPDRQQAIIDDCIIAELRMRHWLVDSDRISRLQRPARSLKGSRQRAMKAIDVITSDAELTARVAPFLISMAKVDDNIDDSEAEAIMTFIRRAREKITK